MTTPNLNEKTVKQLQDLLSVNIDSQKGFLEASEQVKDTELKQLFAEFSQTRAHNAAELRQAISAAGTEPTNSGSMSGTLHRWWLDAKHSMTSGDAVSVLNEAERGEDSIKHTYEDALKDNDAFAARDLIERQYRNVKEGHDRVKALRDTFRARNPK